MYITLSDIQRERDTHREREREGERERERERGREGERKGGREGGSYCTTSESKLAWFISIQDLKLSIYNFD